MRENCHHLMTDRYLFWIISSRNRERGKKNARRLFLSFAS